MIEKEEIEEQAERMGVHHANVERDYVFGWLIKAFFENDYLAPLLVFKGGNCMRKTFYPETRFSGDLDFSVRTTIDVERVQAEINRCCEVAQAACGVQFDTAKNTLAADRALDRERQTYKGRVYFQDFYGQRDSVLISVRVDLTEYDRLYLPTVTRPLIHSYSDASDCRAELQCMALEELLANKLKCLVQRRHSFDLYDLVYAAFFDRTIEVDRSVVLRTFLKKTIFEPSPGAAKEILLGLPMPFFRAAWNKYVAPLGARIDFDNAADGFRSVIDSIFEGISTTPRWGVDPFYPSHYRNAILEAGAGKRLLRAVYDDGRERLVEPYSLAYKRRGDGQAAEYLYVWDRTGGVSSDPGLKTFFHHKLQKLELTDETFEPQYPIELTKAGERRERDYFGRDFGGQPRVSSRRASPSVRRTSGRSRGGSFDETYRVECPYCNKRFTRRSPYDTKLNSHKDPNGWPCSGRVGYPV